MHSQPFQLLAPNAGTHTPAVGSTLVSFFCEVALSNGLLPPLELFYFQLTTALPVAPSSSRRNDELRHVNDARVLCCVLLMMVSTMTSMNFGLPLSSQNQLMVPPAASIPVSTISLLKNKEKRGRPKKGLASVESSQEEEGGCHCCR